MPYFALHIKKMCFNISYKLSQSRKYIIKYNILPSQMFFLKQYNQAAARTLFGAILVQISTSLITIWGNTNVYFLSYLRIQNTSIHANSSAFIVLVANFMIATLTLPSSKLSNKLGYQFMVRISSIVFLIAPFFFVYFPNLWTLIIFFMTLPVSAFSISSIPLMNILWVQFPNHKNKMTSLMIFLFCISGVFWNFVFVYLVNPHNLEASIYSEGRLYFNQEITNNLMKSLVIVVLVAGFLFFVGSLLVTRKKQQKLITEEIQAIQEVENRNSSPSSQQMATDSSKTQPKKSVWSLVFSTNFLLIYITTFINSLFISYNSVNFKLIFLDMFNDDHFITDILIVYNCTSMAAAFFWGWLADKKGIAFTMLLLVILDVSLKLFIFLVKTRVVFAIYYTIVGVFAKGLMTIVGPGLIEVFGIKQGTELLPFKASAVILTYAIVPVGQILIGDRASPLQLLQYLSILNAISLAPALVLWRRVRPVSS